eukprot:2829777-Amphidinium_carterae.1
MCQGEFFPASIGKGTLEIAETRPTRRSAPKSVINMRADKTLQTMIAVPQEQHTVEGMWFGTNGTQFTPCLPVE